MVKILMPPSIGIHGGGQQGGPEEEGLVVKNKSPKIILI